jgi:hypothetical protein
VRHVLIFLGGIPDDGRQAETCCTYCLRQLCIIFATGSAVCHLDSTDSRATERSWTCLDVISTEIYADAMKYPVVVLL